MAKTLYLYADPNDAATDTLRTQLIASGAAFTELNLAADLRKHSVSRGGPLVLIDVDGQVWKEFDLNAASAEIAAQWSAAPSSMPPPPPAKLPKIQMAPYPFDQTSVSATNELLMDALKGIERRLRKLGG